MFRGFSALSILSLQTILPWLVSCSDRTSEFNNFVPTKLVPEYVSELTVQLRDPKSQLVSVLRECCLNEFCEELCLKYILGSVIFFGRVYECALQALCNVYNGSRSVDSAAFLVKELNGVGDHRARVVQVTANLILPDPLFPKEPTGVILELVENNWSDAKAFVLDVLGILGSDEKGITSYHFLLRLLPTESQFDIVNTASAPLWLVNDIYAICEFDPLLRELFVSNLFQGNHSWLVRHVTAQLSGAKQFWGDRIRSVVLQCAKVSPSLDREWWHHIFGFLDPKALSVLSLVCKSWKQLHLQFINEDARMHAWFEEEWERFICHEIHKITPWKYFLKSGERVQRYHNLCSYGRLQPKVMHSWASEYGPPYSSSMRLYEVVSEHVLEIDMS